VTSTPGADRPDQLSVEERTVNEIRVVALGGEMDRDVTDGLRDALLPPDGPTPPRVVVDLAGVTFMDSSGINILLSVHQATVDAGGWLRIAGVRPSVMRVVELVGLHTVITCHATAEQALTS
jgi:stage II sporulation protein AA (anti-sigma F factor antagonist)